MATTSASSATSSESLPATMKALVLTAVGERLKLQTVPTPQATHGSVVVRVICNAVPSVLEQLLTGHAFTFPTPMTPGGTCIGRVAQAGPDTTSLAVGQLVLVESFVRARDNPDLQILWGMYDGPSPQSKKFMADNWASGTFAEYVRTPLENCHPLNEATLCDELGYDTKDLPYLATQLVPFGGLTSVGLKAGERVVIAPATGSFSGSAVPVALAMGATVIAMGRNLAALQRLQATFGLQRVKIVQTTGDVDADAMALQQWGPIDVYIDLSPREAAGSSHVRSAIQSVKQYGRVCLEGIIGEDLAMPYALAVWRNLTIRGQYMYERQDVRNLIKMAEAGVLKLGREGGVEIKGIFGLEEADMLLEVAAANSAAGQVVLLAP